MRSSKNLRQSILESAIDAFRERGLKFTMQEIAEQLHVSKKTIYTEFASKEELLLGMLEYGYGEIDRVKAEIMAMDIPIREKLPKVMIAFPADFMTLDFRELEGLSQKYPDVAKALDKRLRTGWGDIFRLIRDGVKRGELRPINTDILQITFTAACERFLNKRDLKKAGIGYHEALQDLMDILMYGMEIRT